MEELSLWTYLCSVVSGLKMASLAVFIFCITAASGTFFIWCDGECELATAKKWWKWCLAVGIPCMLIFILTPSKKTAYQILGVTVATEVVKNSEALQELPEKSFEALNRFLDSIVPEEEQEE